MPTIAARYTLFLRILAPINSQSSAAHGLPNWSFLLYCMECFAKLQILMKQHAALGVLVLPARDGKMVPAETTGTGCTIIPRRTMVPQLLIPAGSPMALLASQRRSGHCRRHRYRAQRARTAGGGQSPGDPAPAAAPAPRAGAAGLGAPRHSQRHSRTAGRL